MSAPSIAFLFGLPFVVFLLFYRLKIVIKEDELKLSFGIGVITKSIKTKNIVDVKAVKNSVLVGWGIRYTQDYALYNVDGLNAIELTLKDKVRKVRIGTGSTDEIIQYLRAILNQNQISDL